MTREPLEKYRFTYHTNPTEKLRQQGAELVCEVSQATGFPDPAVWKKESLYEHTLQRQSRAHQTIIVSDEYFLEAEKRVVAHSLLVEAQEPSWGNIPEISEYLEAGILAEAGSTAVDPLYQKLGIANTMRKIRMASACELGLIVCVGLWEGSKSNLMYKDSQEWHYLGRFHSSKTNKPIHRYVESRIFS